MNCIMRCLTLGQWIVLASILTGTVGKSDTECNNKDNTDSTKYTANINKPEETSLSQRLWDNSLDIASKALETDFIQGLRYGTLPPTKFGAYVVQDAVYLEKQSEILMIASQNVSMITYRELLIGKAIDYMRYATDLYNEWQLTDSSCVKLDKACQAYTDYKFYVAKTMDPIYTITAMIPCLKLWPWIGQQLQEEHNFGVYTKWVDKNFDPKYDGYKEMDNLVDEWYARGLIEETKAMEVYKNCMTGEYLFFDRAMD